MTSVDAHHHLWDPSERDYPWMPASGVLRRRYDLADYPGPATSVVVQAAGGVEETSALLRTGRAVVGWVDLLAPDVDERIEALRGQGDLVGIRHQVHDEPDPDWLLRDEVQRGLTAVADAGLVFDLLVRERELPAAVETARRQPWLRLVLDHAGKPQQDLTTWRRRLRELAAQPHVACKVSGLVTEPCDPPLVVDEVLGAFGPDRVMVGSDWPVCLLTATYDEVIALARELVQEERCFGETAVAWYGLRPRREVHRVAQVVGVRPEKLREYVLLHRLAFPGVRAALERAGIRNYSIFQRDGLLFAYFEHDHDDLDAALAEIGRDPVTQEWWRLTAPCQQPVASADQAGLWVDLDEVFHLD